MAHPLSRIRILVVDDQALIRKLVAKMLHSWGFSNVTICTDGCDAIEVSSQQVFDLIISDWRMGEIDGIDVLRAIRNSTDPVIARTPFIFLTGNAELGNVETARDAGMNEYLIKPFTAAELMRRVRSVIESPRSFVKAPGYREPDRRRRQAGPPGSHDRRAGA